MMVDAGIKEANLSKMDVEKLINNANVISNDIKGIQSDYYKKRKEEKGNFNFFSAIVSGKNDKQHIEKYHSNVIGYFLDPNASHDFGALFLKKFIDILRDKNVRNLPSEQEVEKLTLEREKQTPTGRFIDISLELERHWIVFIENKIRSGEQQDQMKDYYFFAKEHYTNRLGIYLTREGEMPGSINSKDCDDKLFCMSYADIIVWLQSCCKDEAVKTYPHVLSALKQYITIIKNLLNTMKEDKEAIRKYLLENGNKVKTLNLVKNFGILQDSISELIIEVRGKFLVDLIANLDQRSDQIDYPKIKLLQGDYFWNGDVERCFGLGYVIEEIDGKWFKYKESGFGGCGNGITINNVNAHIGEGIDQTNSLLIECYEEKQKWYEIVKSTADRIIEEIENEVLEKYRSSLLNA